MVNTHARLGVRICTWAGLLSAALAWTLNISQAQEPPNALVEQTRPISASVVATFLRRGDVPELIILWRGRPGWFLGSRTLSGGGDQAGRRRGTISYGAISLAYAFDPISRSIEAQGIRRTLAGTENVVFVDNVDRPKDAVTVEIGEVSRRVNGSTSDAALLASSKAIPPFLRCDVELADAMFSRLLMGDVCAQLKTLQGKR